MDQGSFLIQLPLSKLEHHKTVLLSIAKAHNETGWEDGSCELREVETS